MPVGPVSVLRRLPVVLLGLSVCVAIGGFCLWNAPAMAQAEGFLVTNENAPVYQRIPEIESQLYGHAYPNQAVSQRISRIERTLFGGAQRGPIEARMARIEKQINEKHSQEVLAEQEPMLEYLEDKLFQRTFQEKPLPERVRQLEVQVFGRSFDAYPVSVRIKKLTYAMPLVAKEIRLTSGDNDMVIASTAHTSKRITRSGPPKADMVQLDATGSTIRLLPNGQPLSAGDYAQSIYREGNGSLLRWQNLPIKVYIKPGEANDVVSAQAIRAWQTVFSVDTVPTSMQADVIVAWDRATWEQNTTGLLTKPVVQVDDRHNIRTVILISMFPMKTSNAANQLHVLTHELGHAFGLWGHSDDPGDIMYPALKPELTDFPSRWGWRSSSLAAKVQPVAQVDDARPSQRDVNTLLKIYDLPATDLSTYNPY